MILSLLVFLLLWGKSRLEIESEFEGSAETIAVAIQEMVDGNERGLNRLTDLLKQNPQMDVFQFEEIARPVARENKGLTALNWIQRIRRKDRTRYEKFGRKQYFPEFEFRDEGRLRSHSRAVDREEYFPILFTVPRKANKAALGLDISSNPKTLSALEKARDTGKTAVSLPFRLLQESGYQNAYVVLKPIYNGDETPNTVAKRRERLRGFLEGVYRSGEMVKYALEFIALDDFQVWLFDLIDNNEQPFVFIDIVKGKPRVSLASIGEVKMARRGIHYDGLIKQRDHPWKIIVKATPRYLKSHRSYLPWGGLTIGLLLTLLFSRYLLRRTQVKEDTLNLSLPQRHPS